MEATMGETALNVTEYELAVLEVLWSRGQATIREITEAIYGEISTTAYATVQKLLERLEKKRYVQRDRSSFAHVFRPKIDRSELIDQGLEILAVKLCGGSLTPLLVHLVERTELTDRQRRMLRELIEEAK
jgi:predicted transcriptional regulator